MLVPDHSRDTLEAPQGREIGLAYPGGHQVAFFCCGRRPL